MTEAETWQQESKSLTLYIYDSAGAIAHTITNDSIKSESMQLTQTLEASNALAFKGCNASVFKISLTDLTEDVRGNRLKAVLAAGAYSYTIFDGIIEEQENQTHEDILTSLTAYDYMRQINGLDVTTWAKALTGITGYSALWLLQKFYTEVISVNIPAVTMSSEYFSDWNNTAFTSDPDFSQFDSITGETFIKWLCQCGNVYGYMRGNILAFLKLETFSEPLYPALDLYPSGSLYPSDGSTGIKKITKSNYISLDYEPYKVAKIGGVVVCDSEGVGEGIAPGESVASNSLYIDSNPLAWAMDMETLAADIYNRVKGLTFTPVDIDAPGMPFINLGDIMRASTNKRTVHTYILKRTLKGIQALRDNFDSSADQYQPTHAASYSSITSENGKKILKIQADQVEMQALIADRATIEELNAVSARVGTLEADHVTTTQLTAVSGRVGTLEADHVTTTQLNAVSGRVSTIESNYITADTVQAKYMEVANWTSAGYITASKIKADTFSGRTVSATRFSATYFQTGGKDFASQSITYLDGNGVARTKTFLTSQ